LSLGSGKVSAGAGKVVRTPPENKEISEEEEVEEKDEVAGAEEVKEEDGPLGAAFTNRWPHFLHCSSPA